MFLSNASVKRPVAMSCLIIGLTLLGLNAWRTMGLELMPKMDVPYVNIQTIYPGATPLEIETDVAKRIEDAVGTIDGLREVTSSCMENLCMTQLEFQLGVDVDIAATDVREKLDMILDDFPDDVEDPKIQKFDVNSSPIVTLALTGEVPLDDLYDYADNDLRDRLTVISGVADVEIIGGAEREVQILLDRRALAARGLMSTDVLNAVANGLGVIPSGRVREGGVEYNVKFDADFVNVPDIGDLEIANAEGKRCYLRDVATTRMATEELRQKASLDGKPAIAVKVVKKGDANAVKVADGVEAALEKLRPTMPGGMELTWVTDDATFIRATNNSAWINVAEGILLTAAVLFVFLYNLRALLVVSITMPLTVVIGLFFMDMAGYTLNSSTLIAIGMSVGILVTNSIVVLEAIVKRLDESGDPKAASRIGASETFVAVLASAGTNMVVLLPLAMMNTKVALFISPLAMTMFIMTVVSLFISFTLTPMLCSLLLKPNTGERKTLLAKMEAGFNNGFDRVIGLFAAVLRFNERHRWAAIGLLLVTVGLFMHAMKRDVGMGFFSDPDRGEVYVKVEYPTYYDLAHTNAAIAEVERTLGDLPHVEHVLTTLGKVQGQVGRASEGVHLAQVLLKFNDRTERDMTIDELLAEIRARVGNTPDGLVTVSVASIVGGAGTPVEMDIAGDDLATLDTIATKCQDLSTDMNGLADVDTTVRAGKPELRIRPKREVLADLHRPAKSLGFALRGNLEGLEAGSYKRGDRTYDIVVKYDEIAGRDQVQAFQLPGEPGRPILLGNVAEVNESTAPVQINRKNKRRIAKLYANLGPGMPLGTATDMIGAAIDKEANLPAGYDYHFAGQAEVMKEANAGFTEALLTAIVLVILTLAAILESFKQPWLILVTLPLAMIGVLWALAAAGMSLDMFVIMGIVMMVGIVVNNAILIMDQLNVHIAEGVPPHKAMIAASCERFRPIVMITVAAVLGMAPLALGRGIGAELRNGVGVASVGGILVSGVLTLFVLPVLYDLFTRKSKTAPAGE